MAPRTYTGGLNRQRVTYDQLSLTQFIQGFVKNIIDEQDRDCRDKMLLYLGDLMEDATDFSWTSAKSPHAVLLCEMERGSLDWFILIELIAKGVLMLSIIVLHKNRIGKRQMTKPKNHGFAKLFRWVCVLTVKTTRTVARITGIFVLIASPKVEF